MTINEKALETAYRAVRDEWTYFPAGRAEWLKVITKTLETYLNAIGPDKRSTENTTGAQEKAAGRIAHNNTPTAREKQLADALREIRDSDECHEEWYKTIAREALKLSGATDEGDGV